MPNDPATIANFRRLGAELQASVQQTLPGPTRSGDEYLDALIRSDDDGSPEGKRKAVRRAIDASKESALAELETAVAAKGHEYYTNEYVTSLHIVFAGHRWLEWNGNEAERAAYSALYSPWETSVLADPAARQIVIDEVEWLDAAYVGTGHAPTTPWGTQWSDVLELRDRLLAGVDQHADALADYIAENRIQASSVESDDAEWAVTPDRAIGSWIETTTRMRTLIDTVQYTAARMMIRELDDQLHDATEGGVPPGAGEEDGLYLDALDRSAIPHETAVPGQVLEQLRADGIRVPDFPQPDHVQQSHGIHALTSTEIRRALTEPGKSPTPRTHEALVFARAWSQATTDLDTDLVVSYDITGAPRQALVERLDGTPDAYVNAMRTGPGQVVLTDSIGNEHEPDVLTDRLGLEPGAAEQVLTGLRDGLDAAEDLRDGPMISSQAPAAKAEQSTPTDATTAAQLPPHGPTNSSSPTMF